MAKAPALGKGLGALIATRPAGLTAPLPGERVVELPLKELVPSPLQPRGEFREEQLAELAQSIRERGIIQPLIVRQSGAKYEIIAGERRWRAAQQAGLDKAPVIVREASDLEVLELALVENLQREDLNPIEEALAYARLSREFALTQEEIARKVGKNRATVANAMRLLDLDPEVQGYVRQGRLTVGHAKALLSLKDHAQQRLLAQQVIRQGAPVRAAERMVARFLSTSEHPGGGRKRSSSVNSTQNEPHIARLEQLLAQRLGTRVVLRHKDGAGSLTVDFYSLDELQRLLDILGVEVDG